VESSRTSSINEEIKSRSKDKTFSEVGTAKANQMQDSGFIPAAKLMRGPESMEEHHVITPL
jgi:hypothetical protein